MYSKLFYYLLVVSVLLILFVVRNGRFGNDEFPKTKDYSRSAMYNKRFPTYESAFEFLKARWNCDMSDKIDRYCVDLLYCQSEEYLDDSLSWDDILEECDLLHFPSSVVNGQFFFNF